MNLSEGSIQKAAVIPPIGLAILYVLMALVGIGEGSAYPNPELLFALNTLFLTVSGLIIAILSAWSYHSEGNLGLLLLGMATAVGGVLASIAGFAATISVNYNVALFNLGFLFSGGFQLLSAVLIVAGAAPTSQESRKHLLVLSYSATAALIIAVSVLVLGGFAPTFFSDSGPTAIRQWIIVGAGVLSAVSGALLGWQYHLSKSKVIFWYALALALLAISLVGLATYKTPNGIDNWATRVAYWLAGVYFLVAILTARPRRSLDSSIDLRVSSTWAESFQNDSRQLENLFSKMFDGFSYHKILFQEGRPVDYIYIAVNDAFEEMTGLKRKDIIGKKVTEVLPGIEKDPADWIGVYGKVAITGQPVIFESYAAPLDKWYSVSAYSPRKGYFVVISEDITKRKKAEEKTLRQAALIDLSPDAIVIRNLDGTIKFWSAGAEKLYGWSKQEAIGQVTDQLFRTEFPKKYADVLAELSMNGRWTGQLKHLTKYGETVIVQSYWLAIRNNKDEITEIFESNVDVTRLVNLQEKLENQAVQLEEFANQMEQIAQDRLNKLKDAERLAAIGATAGMVGHDIRNPLQAITSDAYLAKAEIETLPDSEQKKMALESIEEIEKNTEYINKIVQDLQDYARPLNPKIEESDLKLVVEELIAKNDLPENIDVKIDIKENARKIKVDAYYLNRILANLVSNAVQAMPKGGKLIVQARKDKQETLLSVKDTGVGIPEKIKDKMFTLMFTTKSKGQGFGLPVVKRMTESLGGTVTFESQEGKGTTFTVRLPHPKNSTLN